MTVVSFNMAYRSFQGGSGRLDTRLDTPPSINRRHPNFLLSSPRHDATRSHLVQHPSGCDPALGGVENQNAVNIALSGELMARAREYPLVAVEVVARAEIVGGDERRSGNHRSNALVAAQQDRH